MKKKLTSLIAIGLLLSATTSFAEDYTYDEYDRLIKVTYSDGSYISYEYDLTGNIIKEIMVSQSSNNSQDNNASNSDNNNNGNNSGNSGGSNDNSNNNNSGSGNNNNGNSQTNQVEISLQAIGKSNSTSINAKIVNQEKDGTKKTTITINNTDIQNLKNSKQDLQISYEGKIIRIDKSQLNKIKNKQDFTIEIESGKTSEKEITNQLTKTKYQLKKIEQEFSINTSVKIDVEITYTLKETSKLKYYRSFEIDGKKVKIKNVKQQQKLTIKTKTGTQKIGIILVKDK